VAQRPTGRVITAEPEKAGLLTSAHRGLREAALIFALAAGGWFLLALLSYDAADPGWSHSATAEGLHNLAGVTGAFAADLLFSLFGWLAGLLPLTFLVLAVLQFKSPTLILAVPRAVIGLRALGFFIFDCREPPGRVAGERERSLAERRRGHPRPLFAPADE
jgi:S-DNA-T family DNA segregation ATPase FtsK/SpoIIIE